MEVMGSEGMNTLTSGLNAVAVQQHASAVFGAFAGVLVGAVVLTLTVHFIRKILNGANKGQARIK